MSLPGGICLAVGPTSSVVLATTYLDKRVRLGRGGRGSSFVFTRGGPCESAGCQTIHGFVQIRCMMSCCFAAAKHPSMSNVVLVCSMPPVSIIHVSMASPGAMQQNMSFYIWQCMCRHERYWSCKDQCAGVHHPVDAGCHILCSLVSAAFVRDIVEQSHSCASCSGGCSNLIWPVAEHIIWHQVKAMTQ